MKLNKVVSTLEMPHEEWLRYRKKGIGGSDAGAICGVNKYRSGLFAMCPLGVAAPSKGTFFISVLPYFGDIFQYLPLHM